MRAWLGVLAVAVLLTAAGCGVPTSDGAQPLPEEVAELASAEQPEATLAAPARPTDLAWVDGSRLRLSPRVVSGGDTVIQATAALAAAISGPTPAEVSRGLSTEIPPDLEAALSIEGSSANIELPAPTGIVSSNVTLASAQLAIAVLLVPGIDSVTFTVGGVPAEVPRADGRVGTGPVTLADYATLLRPGSKR